MRCAADDDGDGCASAAAPVGQPRGKFFVAEIVQ